MFISKKELKNIKEIIAYNSRITCLSKRVHLTVDTDLQFIESRLAKQEKMQKMLFAHLGIEYAKTTEETAAGRQEKEVLRKVRKQK